MSVILEFTIDNEQFSLGRVLSGAPPMRIQLERIVPTGDTIMSFLWATGEDFDTFEQTVADHPFVESFVAVDTVENSTLYRGVWAGNHDSLIEGIVDVEGTILEGRSTDDQWEFHLRLLDHDNSMYW
ncbi:bacterio-opsin activator domain-containing protein [Natrialbaceae archaeon A-CW3]